MHGTWMLSDPDIATAAESRAWNGTYLLTCMDTTTGYGANGRQAWSATYLLTSIKPFSQ